MERTLERQVFGLAILTHLGNLIAYLENQLPNSQVVERIASISSDQVCIYVYKVVCC